MKRVFLSLLVLPVIASAEMRDIRDSEVVFLGLAVNGDKSLDVKTCVSAHTEYFVTSQNPIINYKISKITENTLKGKVEISMTVQKTKQLLQDVTWDPSLKATERSLTCGVGYVSAIIHGTQVSYTFGGLDVKVLEEITTFDQNDLNNEQFEDFIKIVEHVYEVVKKHPLTVGIRQAGLDNGTFSTGDRIMRAGLPNSFRVLRLYAPGLTRSWPVKIEIKNNSTL